MEKEEETMNSKDHNTADNDSTLVFPWKHIYDDCFSCEIGDYYLRVEQMEKGHWWWRVYYKGEAIPELTNEFSNSKDRAIGNCEGLYMGHLLKVSKRFQLTWGEYTALKKLVKKLD